MSIASSHAPTGAPDDFRIGEWRLAARGNELRRGDEVVHLEPKAAELLAYLARHPGEVVGREDLLAAVWPGVVVGDDALTQAIIKLRKALGDDAQRPKYIETISKRGYRLIAPVAAAAEVARRPVSRPSARIRKSYVAAAAVLLFAAVAAFLAAPRLPWPIGADKREASRPLALPVVAVLPLANLSGDPKRDYFSDGLTEDLIQALGRFSEIRVMSFNAVQGYRGMSTPPQAIRDQYGARYIVRGSVRESDGKLRVSVELSDTEQGALLASETYDGGGGQLFEIQDRIVRNLVGKLQVTLTSVERQRVFDRPAGSLEAHDLVLRARALLNRPDRVANREARALLARARELAPDYGEVYNTLGAAEFQRATDGFMEDAQEGIRRAEAHLKHALASADVRAHARAHSTLAAIYSHQNRLGEALAQARRAVELNPSDAYALYWEGAALMFGGRIKEATATLETARRFDPHPSPGRGINLAIAYYVVERYADAVAETDALLPHVPRNSFLLAMRAAALAQLGREDEARIAAEQVLRFNPLFDPDNFGSRFEDPVHTAKLREGLRKAGL